MGVVNVTPDSFSGDGVLDVSEAVDRARQMLAEGADVIDVGGESTRPGADPVAVEEELRRVVPVVQALVRDLRAVVSIDTQKAEVARRGLESGAAMINDVSALAPSPGGADAWVWRDDGPFCEHWRCDG
jgi:dihydropteroate synthase